MLVGDRVIVDGRGAGILALDNEDGTWNVEFDDDTEGDVPVTGIEICVEEKFEQTDEMRDRKAVMLAELARQQQAVKRLPIKSITPALQEDLQEPGCALIIPDLSEHWHSRHSILCVGDSLTEGLVDFSSKFSPYSDQLELRLRDAFGSDCVPKIINAGLSGESTRDMVPRLRRLMTKGPGSEVDDDACLFSGTPDIVLILGGTNDLSKMQPNHIAQNLFALHEIAHMAGAMTGVLTIPQCFSMTSRTEIFKEVREEVNSMLREFAKANCSKAILVDVAVSFASEENHANFWSKDGTHFSVKGYKAFGDLLAGTHL